MDKRDAEIKEMQVEVEEKLAEGRKKVEAELAEALAKLEEQKGRLLRLLILKLLLLVKISSRRFFLFKMILYDYLGYKQSFGKPYDKSKNHKASLVFTKYAISKMDLLKANFGKEWLLIKRNSFLYIFKTVQIIVMAFIGSTVFLRTNLHTQNEEDTFVYIGALTFTMVTHLFNSASEMFIILLRLPVFYKHRDLLFHPAWASTLPNFILRVPISIIETLAWMVVTYYSIGFTPEVSRFFKHFLLIILIQQMAAGFYRMSSAVCRTHTISMTVRSFILLFLFLFGGFAIPRDKIPDWLSWGYWCSPLSYAYNALVVNEFLSPRWMNKMDSKNTTSLGIFVLETVSIFPELYWFLIGAGALLGFTVAFNILFTFALMYLDPLGKPQAVIPEDDVKREEGNQEPKKKIKSSNIKIE